MNEDSFGSHVRHYLTIIPAFLHQNSFIEQIIPNNISFYVERFMFLLSFNLHEGIIVMSAKILYFEK